MKKVLLSSVAALAVFAAAAPVFAQGENPNASNQLIQKKYVSWRDAADEANTQVAAHEAEINAEAENDPAVVAAKQALEAYGSGHEYETYVAKLEAARAEARNTVRNRYIQVFQQNYINAAKAQGNYYDETAVEANRTNEQRIADDIKAQTGKDVTVTTDEKGNVVVKDEKGNVIGTVDKNGKLVKADAKAGKALPKTSAVK
ncbi:MAG: amylase-binding adhesin AbpA [Streptococcus parasanguinis]|uniref:amylase-binding adhesin AbpA n=1 Tax=Streptococcus parasanguinis TaxID=1318 RepID=UPI00066AA9B9|nr:amylase-binding adhesin AbpA [Streptococcus parasanguinis]MBS7077401.1 amylase-binding protein [Streptococcus parasanguinis]MDU2418372.1 amylase-binding adhesin AbpA [Streptococcus parasanguinis]MDU6759563.1 amylase-binding adhesin AbpA [Streptococcus parasanguinis]